MINKLVFGTAQLTSMRSYCEIKYLLNKVCDLGINEIDTARGYGGGYCEYVIGKYLKKNPGSFKVNTKVGFGLTKFRKIPISIILPVKYYFKKRQKIFTDTTIDLNAPLGFRSEKIDFDYFKKSIQLSFDLLGKSQINTLLLHELVPEELDEKSLEYLKRLILEERVLRLGVGTDSRKLKQSKELEMFEVCQYRFSAYDELKRIFPDKIHYCHSVFSQTTVCKETALISAANYVSDSDRIIFNTSKICHLPRPK